MADRFVGSLVQPRISALSKFFRKDCVTFRQPYLVSKATGKVPIR